MKFPSLSTMIEYGIYTVRELERYHQNMLPKRKIIVLQECDRCSFVYPGHTCNNCHE
ncbi:hypothetical protein [Dishui Lake phycodnavirus 3]|nr:hypothetical protein [Dishui Lake phycodnavirus 3]